MKRILLNWVQTG